MARWKKGESGNPRGRPPRTDTDRVLREKIRKACPEVVDQLIEAAKSGDTSAAKLLMERALPALRPLDLPAPLSTNPDATLSEIARAALASVVRGAMTPGQAKDVLSGISATARVLEVEELIQRVEALEQAITKPLGGFRTTLARSPFHRAEETSNDEKPTHPSQGS